jgi:hypothetical protein
MAHADYDCCAICDAKQDYNAGNARTKEDLCASCLKILREHGVNALDVAGLSMWIECTEKATVQDVLRAAQYAACHYPNDLDAMVWQRLGQSRRRQRL